MCQGDDAESKAEDGEERIVRGGDKLLWAFIGGVLSVRSSVGLLLGMLQQDWLFRPAANETIVKQ